MERQKDIASGRLKPFAAPSIAIKDNEGNTVIAIGNVLTDREILGMNWLVEGIQGKLAK
jgi:basic membrane protein A and related proteins